MKTEKPKAGQSDNLLEMAMEQNPAMWAAYQISAKCGGCKTVGEAMQKIEAIVNQAIAMHERFKWESFKREIK